MTPRKPNTRIFNSITARKLTVALVAAVVLLLLTTNTNAQNNTNATDGSTPAGLAPGVPSGSYALSGFDNVNLYNGSMNFRLPLVSIGGRGGAGYTMLLPIEQHWTVDNYYDPFTAPSVVNTPTANSWDVIKPGYYPGVMQKRQVGFMTFYCTGEPYNKKWRRTVTRLTFTANDGTEYELVDQLTSGAVHFTSSACTNTQFSRGKVFISHDGSGATFISDTNVLDPLWAGEEMGMTSSDAWTDTEVSGYLFLRDGSRYRISGGYVTDIRDRNGNKLTFTSDANFNLIVTDSLNRQVTVNYNYQDAAPYGLCDRITFKGFAGATRIVRVSKDAATGKSTAVWLPNDDGLNRHYQFYYNSYAELRRVELPTGGAVEYDWDQGLTYSPPADFVGMFPDANSSTFEQQIYRRVVEKRVYPDGVTLESRTTFSRPETCSDSSCSSIPNLGYVDVEQRKADGSLLGRQRHFFNGVGAANSMIAFHIMPPIVNDMEGRETQTEIYDFNGTTLLRRTVNTWEGATVLGQGPHLIETNTTLSDTNQVAKQTFGYDIYGNRTDAYEYDFGSGVAGPLIRRTHTDYLTTNPINGADYACDRATTCGPNANLSS